MLLQPPCVWWTFLLFSHASYASTCNPQQQVCSIRLERTSSPIVGPTSGASRQGRTLLQSTQAEGRGWAVDIVDALQRWGNDSEDDANMPSEAANGTNHSAQPSSFAHDVLRNILLGALTRPMVPGVSLTTAEISPLAREDTTSVKASDNGTSPVVRSTPERNVVRNSKASLDWETNLLHNDNNALDAWVWAQEKASSRTAMAATSDQSRGPSTVDLDLPSEGNSPSERVDEHPSAASFAPLQELPSTKQTSVGNQLETVSSPPAVATVHDGTQSADASGMTLENASTLSDSPLVSMTPTGESALSPLPTASARHAASEHRPAVVVETSKLDPLSELTVDDVLSAAPARLRMPSQTHPRPFEQQHEASPIDEYEAVDAGDQNDDGRPDLIGIGNLMREGEALRQGSGAAQ